MLCVGGRGSLIYLTPGFQGGYDLVGIIRENGTGSVRVQGRHLSELGSPVMYQAPGLAANVDTDTAGVSEWCI